MACAVGHCGAAGRKRHPCLHRENVQIAAKCYPSGCIRAVALTLPVGAQAARVQSNPSSPSAAGSSCTPRSNQQTSSVAISHRKQTAALSAAAPAAVCSKQPLALCCHAGAWGHVHARLPPRALLPRGLFIYHTMLYPLASCLRRMSPPAGWTASPLST